MTRILVVALVTLSLLVLPGQACGVEAVLTPAELVSMARDLDGTRVTVRGEAIGDSLRADADHRWVNLLGGGTGVGVWMRDTDAATIRSFGYYEHTGDVLEVTGVLHVACERHGGEFDVHAEEVSVVERGAPIEHPLEVWKAAVGLGGIALAVLATRRYGELKERGID